MIGSMPVESILTTTRLSRWKLSGMAKSSTGSGAQVQHAYTVPGTYRIGLTVTDHALQSHSAETTLTVTVNDPPEADPGGPYVFDEAYAYRGQWTDRKSVV